MRLPTGMQKLSAPQKAELDSHRESLLAQIDRILRGPMFLLGFIWIVLIVLQFIQGLSSGLKILTTAIWIIFILDFLLRFFIAPEKKEFLKNNWLTTLALIVPALRIFQFV